MALSFERLWLILGLGFVLLVVFLSLTPEPLRTPTPYGVKLGHILAYAWLMLWFAQLYLSFPARLGIAAAFCTMGIGLEYLQGLTGYRSFAYADMGYNAVGLALGWLLGLTPLQYLSVALKSKLQARHREE